MTTTPPPPLPALGQTSFYFLGCGKMGSALLKAWIAAGASPQYITARTASPSSAEKLHATYGIHASDSAPYAGQDVVILAVKPQILPEALPAFAGEQRPLYISLAAGKTLAYFNGILGAEARVIRTMPNTPSQLGLGMTALSAGENATQDDTYLTSHLFRAAGEILWMEESRIDAAAAIAGSGPAYLFHFAEALMANAKELGFSEEEAKLLTAQTLSGSVALAEAGNWDVARLRQDVTSKAGVTEAALNILMPALTPLLREALLANIARSKTLSA